LFDLVIPDLMNKQIEQVECYNFFRGLIQINVH
jgi:hypothetical protein